MKSIFFACGLLLTSIFLVSCIDLAVNDGKNKHVNLQKNTYAKGEVYTMRGGLGGVFSKGMNRLEDTLENDYHVASSSTVWYKANALSHAIIKRYQTEKTHGPIILVGHSLGANEQIKVAKQLAQANIPVALLITVDAVSPLPVPPNVQHAFNIYRPSFVPMFSGLPLKAMDPTRTRVENVNISRLKHVDVNHFTIDGNKEIQRLMLYQVLTTLNKNSRCETSFC